MRPTALSRNDDGSALVHTLFVSFLLAAAAGTYALLSMAQSESLSREEAILRARLGAENGVHLCIAELKSGEDPGGDGLGNLDVVDETGRRISVAVEELAPPLYRIRSRASVARATQTLEVVAEFIATADGLFNPLAAVTARGNVETTGNINIDGRDHDSSGTVILGPGLAGIAAGGTIENNGSSSVGGAGIAPDHPAPPGTILPEIAYGDAIDGDGDGEIDEEQLNGIDDDGDGLVDEDLEPFPESPDALFGLDEGTFAQFAQDRGTYFTSEDEFNDYRAANGGFLPGGQIYVLDFPLLRPAYLSSDPEGDPSILIQHQENATARMKNIHGFFKGLMLLDDIEHFNADFLAVGAVISFGTGVAVGNNEQNLVLGNGTADIIFSSSVLNNLPGLSGGFDIVRVRSWHKGSNVD